MASFRRIIMTVIGISLGAIIGAMPYLRQINAIEQKAEVRINDQYILANIAKTQKTRETGLSGRTELSVNEGMLFIFDEPGRYGFWMKGMNLPIDIIWINGERIVGIQERVQNPVPGTPDSELSVYFPPEDIDKVLEVASGRANLLRARAGNVVQTKTFAPKLEIGR